MQLDAVFEGLHSCVSKPHWGVILLAQISALDNGVITIVGAIAGCSISGCCHCAGGLVGVRWMV